MLAVTIPSKRLTALIRRSPLLCQAGRHGANQGVLLGSRGDIVPFDLGDVVLPNPPPRLSGARLIQQRGFDVIVAAAAIDIDGEPTTISVDWGDGTVSTGRNVIYRHSYANARFQAYTIRMQVTDSRGLSDTHEIEIDIVRPALREADVSSLTWVRLTEAESNFDGVRGFTIDPEGTLFAHNYLDIVRRSDDGGQTWDDVLDDVECCGGLAHRDAGEIFVASPSGLYFSGDNGENWTLFDESKFDAVTISPDKQFVVATTTTEVRRYDMTARLVDTWRLAGRATDIETCATGNRSALATAVGQVFINDRRDMAPAGWQIPEDRFAKNKGMTSVSFDKACNLYNGLWNGYRS